MALRVGIPLVTITGTTDVRALYGGLEIGFGVFLLIATASAGVLLFLLTLLWMRAAVIVYALFFGLRPFPGLDHIVPMLFTTAIGWAMLVAGGEET